MVATSRLNKFVDSLRSSFNFSALLNKAFAIKDSGRKRLTTELLFQITRPDSVSVNLKVSISFSINKCDEEAIKNDPFREINEQNLRHALADTLEENLVRFFCGQSLTHAVNLKGEAVDHIKLAVRRVLHSWGYKLHDIKIQDFEVTDPNNLTALSVIGLDPLTTPNETPETEDASKLVDADVNVLISRLENTGSSIFGQDMGIGVRSQMMN